LEGNIGSGKSLMLTKLKTQLNGLNVLYIPEPIDLWTNFCSQNILQQFYENTAKIAFLFQNFALQTLFFRQIGIQVPEIIIMERSIKSTLLFIEMLYRQNLLSFMETNVLFNWANILVKIFPPLLQDGVVFLRVKPETALERIKTRNRQEENNVTLEYLKNIGDIHTKAFDKNGVDISTYELDCNKTHDELEAEYIEIAEWIRKMLWLHKRAV
jgi:deoxyadenosine/deoxycytidine kinase